MFVMMTDLPENEIDVFERLARRAPVSRPAVAYPMPASMVMTERATAALRAELVRRGTGDWPIVYSAHPDLYDVESHLPQLGETASWEPLAGLAGGESVDSFTHGDWGAKRWPVGVLYLNQHRIALARWYWADAEGGQLRVLWLCAAESNEHFLKLRKDLTVLRRDAGGRVWQVIHSGYDDPERLPRHVNGPEIVLSDALRDRIDNDVVKFFSPEVIAMYRSLGVPHRRGLLLYGPPGNGKTSLIRRVGTLIPKVPGLILRASANFDSDDLEAVVKRWSDLAPAMLVIEDLDWLLKAVNVSTFLNTLDGISCSAEGLLLIATTNHPENLDPAINNRPGRFDVAIEMPNPDGPLRHRFLISKLPEMPHEAIASVAQQCDGLSFAHLQEVLRLSGLLAIKDNRIARSVADLCEASETVQATNRTARDGFPAKLDVPFGFVRRKASAK
jgi:hypothetical protein